jgi:predicted transcriptional regulator
MEGGVQNRKSGRSGTSKGSLTRTTVVLSEELDRNIEVLCSIERRPKGEVIAAAIKQFLERKGLQPDKSPKGVNVIY